MCEWYYFTYIACGLTSDKANISAQYRNNATRNYVTFSQITQFCATVDRLIIAYRPLGLGSHAPQQSRQVIHSKGKIDIDI